MTTRPPRPFVHDGRRLEVRASTSNEETWNVAVFEGDDQVSAIAHVKQSDEEVGDAMSTLERQIKSGAVPLWPKKE